MVNDNKIRLECDQRGTNSTISSVFHLSANMRDETVQIYFKKPFRFPLVVEITIRVKTVQIYCKNLLGTFWSFNNYKTEDYYML